jgi:hypothetical protein
MDWNRTAPDLLPEEGAEVDVTRQVRQMFGATYDDFRKFWSHDWTLQSVEAAS